MNKIYYDNNTHIRNMFNQIEYIFSYKFPTERKYFPSRKSSKMTPFPP